LKEYLDAMQNETNLPILNKLSNEGRILMKIDFWIILFVVWLVG